MDLCIYHSRDFDGYSSAAIIKSVYPKIKLMGYDYDDEVPDIDNGQYVVMVDVSFDMEFMIALAARSKGLLWIDHHKSSIEKYEKVKDQFGTNFRAYVTSGKAACELTWEATRPGRKMPTIIHMLGIYDTFRKEEAGDSWDSIVMPLQYGLKLTCDGPETFPMELLDRTNISALMPYIESGKLIMKYVDVLNKDVAKCVHTVEIDGKTGAAINTQAKSSTSFNHVQDKKDFMMVYSRSKDKWNVSFYSDDGGTDCSEIALKFGGGGHAGAAGCVLDDAQMFKILIGK